MIRPTLLLAGAALLPLTVPAAAQMTHHGGMTMPMPAANKPVKKAVPKKAAPRTATVRKPAPRKAAAKPAPPAHAAPAATAPPDQMDHGAMDMPPPPPPTPLDQPAMDHSAMDHSAMAQPATDHGSMAGMAGHGEHAMAGAFGAYPMTRESSGTAWQPDASEHMGLMREARAWTLMGHGTLNLVADWQSGRRGDSRLFASGMLMGMARRPIGNGTLQFKAMLSPDPLMGKRGYPLLLASGETANGRDRLIDRQHPHDLFMELSASLSQNLAANSSAFLYAGVPGEPAFGPPAFMHREAIMDSPEAPVSHHWLDSTHISFGVLTAGLVLGEVKVEASRFNGREPDQHRWNIETGALDSTALRLSWNPSRNWSLQGSWGHFTDPEQLEPGIDQRRWSASALYAGDIAPNLKLAATLAWGRKTVEGHRDDAYVAEAALKRRQWTLFGRAEMTENRELLDVEEGRAYRVGKASLGLVRDVPVAKHLALGIGGLVSVNAVPSGLADQYGRRHPLGAMAFVRVKID